jgi:superfamily I DNA and/or RNA helicase
MGGQSVFFIDHRSKEQREEGGCSYFNIHEAEFVIRFARFLCEQGVQPQEITIVTAYAAQQRLIEDKRRQLYFLRSIDAVHVTTIDNYQGEENRIIILSLVRNNDSKSVGFLRTSNRVCVALSRAQHGLFILGNMAMLSASQSPIWRHVHKVLIERNQLAEYLTLTCDRHPQTTLRVTLCNFIENILKFLKFVHFLLYR